MNVWSAIGNLVSDGELRFTNSGTAVCNITVAVSKRFKGEEITSFIDCVLWGKYAEAMVEYLKKGKKVGITGELNQKKYEKDGENRYRYEVTVRDLDLLSPKNDQTG